MRYRHALVAGLLILVGGIAGFPLYNAYSNWHLINVIHGMSPTAGITFSRDSKWIQFHETRVPHVLASLTSAASDRQALADGAWTYSVAFTSSKEEPDRSFVFRTSAERRFTSMWITQLQGLGYFRTEGKPSPRGLKEFQIKEPNGRTWVASDSAGNSRAHESFMLALLMELADKSWKYEPCMRVARGTFPYAIAFTGLRGRLGLDEAIAASCAADQHERVMAAEILIDRLPIDHVSSDTQSFDAARYESTLASLATPMTIEEKRSLFATLRGSIERKNKGRTSVQPTPHKPDSEPPSQTQTATESDAPQDSSVRNTSLAKYAPGYALVILMICLGLFLALRPKHFATQATSSR